MMKTLGQIAFEAYSAAVGGTTYDKKPIPPWGEITPQIQQAWEDAAKAALFGLGMELTEATSVEEAVWYALTDTYRKLKAAKPADRSEKARRYAVTITEYEKVMSYFNTMTWEGFEA